MNALHKAILGLLFLSPFPLLADTITNLSGRLHTPDETVNFNFSVQTIVSDTFVEDILSGFVRLTGSGHPRTITIVNDGFIFGLDESAVMLECGFPVTYLLTGDIDSVEIITLSPATARSTVSLPSARFAAVSVDSAAVPEPGTLLLLLAGLFTVKKKPTKN